MSFRYNGGDCFGSFNVQFGDVFDCVDENGSSPPSEEGTISYIVAVDSDTEEEYFSDFVAVAGDFTMVPPQGSFGSSVTVSVYSVSESSDPIQIIQEGNLLQTLLFDSSCSSPNLQLKDRFGSIQLVVYENSLQGSVTCFQEVTLTFIVQAPLESGSVNLTSLVADTNIETENDGIFDITEDVVGSVVTPQAPLFFTENIPIDLTVRQKYSIEGTVIGEIVDKRCFGNDLFEFTAGNPLPPIFPTAAPSPAPTITASPTPDPLTAECLIAADIDCELANGDGSCEDLRSPSTVTCLGGNADFLQFIYVPDSLCANGDNNATNFECSDFNLELQRPRSAYIRVLGEDSTWFEGSRTAGQIIDIPVAGDSVTIEVYNAPEGDLLQQSVMSIRCDAADGMTLSTTFGHMELVGFRNTEVGLQQVFASLVITYTASNIGFADLDLIGAFGSSPFSGFQDFLGGDVPVVAPDASQSFVERLTLNLSASVGIPFAFTFLAQGNGSLSQVFCEATNPPFTLLVS